MQILIPYLRYRKFTMKSIPSFTDRSIYAVGEKIWFKVSNISHPKIKEKIGAGDLHGTDKTGWHTIYQQ